MKKVLMLINDTTYAYNLRAAILRRLISEGYEVVIVGQLLKHQEKLKKIGCRLIGVETGRHGTNPIDDFKLMLQYRKILKIEKPDVVLTYNIKPNVYGGLVSKQLSIKYIPNVTGLGTPVEQPGKLQKLTIQLYKMGISGASCVFFQNEDNRQFFIDHRMLKTNAKAIVLPGSGVDLQSHPYMEYPQSEETHFLFAARVMKEKGIDLYLNAARKYASEKVIFDICGACDDEKYLKILKNEKAVVYHGEQKDMVPFYRECSCFLYPSYYPEGMSNVLLEAAASGRPVVAANRPGCKETVENNKTGYIVPVNNEQAVLDVVETFLKLSVEERKIMGMNGREKVEKEFDREIVVDAYMKEIMNEL